MNIARAFLMLFKHHLDRLKRSRFSYEERKALDIEDLRKKGVKIGSNTDIIESYLDGLFPFLIEIGSNCIITGATILCHDSSHLLFSKRIKVGKVIINDNCFVGRGAVLLPGVHIGEKSIIGVNATVTKDIPSESIAAGTPARVIGSTRDLPRTPEDTSRFVFTRQIDGNFLTLGQIRELRRSIEAAFLERASIQEK